MNEIESCNLESVGTGRKRVAGNSKIAKRKIITRRGKITRKVKSHGKA